MENKPSKYFKYAVGEILLVVIGILIALQINNWNESRKSDAFEKEMLTQIQANLIKDRLTLEEIIDNNESAINSSTKLLELNDDELQNDSIKHWLADVMQFDRFQPLTNAYEVLKSKGLDQISNKQLRFLLGAYYDDKASHIGKALEDLQKTFENDWMPILKTNIIEFKFKKHVILEDQMAFFNSNLTRNILILNIDNYGGSSIYIKEGLTIIDKIMELIREEL